MNLIARSAIQLLRYGAVSMPLRGKVPILMDWSNYFTKHLLSIDMIQNGILCETGRVINYRNNDNLGILTGAISNCIVVDIDDMKAVQKLRQLGSLPRTWTVRTRRGFHLYFNYNESVKSMSLWKQIDILSDKKQVVAPPSWNAAGARYEWVVSPKMAAKADLPMWFIKLLAEQQFNRMPSSLVYTNEDGFKRNDYNSHIQAVNWLDVFARHTTNICGKGQWLSSTCPFHDDRKNSFSFNVNNGGWVCYAGCGKGGGLHFLERIYGLSKKQAWQLLKGENVYV